MKHRWSVCLLAALALTCGGPASSETEAAAPAGSEMTLTSPAFAPGGPMPAKYTADGEDVSPPLEWDGVPEGVDAFAIICRDPDAKAVAGKVWIHWLVYNIPRSARGLEEDYSGKLGDSELPAQGVGSSGQQGYRGPSPPPGPVHHYHYRLYALDMVIRTGPGAAVEDVLEAMRGHVVAEAELVGTYRR